ncbi:hypothetical protein [Enemella evansiae]|uniref:Extradiol ring-cleavage dioxygenase LigAB LigA subunit domain-containing protein n=1 Tax=Enemella evansiae TaxID=2016499 RepID=A0A255GSA3_9ACTN|nr:hypothetical protein [Enemella evansiae]OYN96813.1 hypothetical protein CGZ96_10955 [Enemella evansiae]OYO00790.1 hypothetical protein CGZ95_09230 [Enemella evansiae]OYO02592.1 hypothetical protein CGZ97_14370 [Enemella evansiae]OYO12046.1 hypothetical protein CGZ98_07605 [Enemella evansiae]OYO14067.1 hypothetical protein BI335_12765 [Enemella evansiae]
MFDHLRRLEDPNSDRAADDLVTEGYELDERERAAARNGDVAEFHDLGVHPVLINGYCRANGWKRADYKQLFRAEQIRQAENTGRTRWQKS